VWNLFIVVLTSCRAGDSPVDRPSAGASVARDSAGVAIVESRGPRWTAATAWVIGADPVLDIGAADGSAEFQFDGIEGLLRLEDGGLVVADAGSGELRFYDPAGRFSKKTGGRGSGPGEFQRIITLGRGPGDSLWVYDFGARRFTILTPEGETARTVRVPDALANVGAVGRTPDGSFVLQEYWSSRPHDESPASELVREDAAIATMSPTGDDMDTLGVFPGREIVIWSENGRAVMSTPLFAHSTSVALVGGSVFIGDQSRFEIGEYALDGRLLRIVRLPEVSLALSGSEVERALASELATQPESERAMWRAHFERMAVPETRPAYSRLLGDPEGNLWVGAYARDPRDVASWTVFDASGAWLGGVDMPDRFRVLEIGSSWVLGRWLDDLDVEHVRLHELHKPAAQRRVTNE
jgi:hypothetical protein